MAVAEEEMLTKCERLLKIFIRFDIIREILRRKN